jgi:flagella basal body P-ring formation protein FlgA
MKRTVITAEIIMVLLLSVSFPADAATTLPDRVSSSIQSWLEIQWGKGQVDFEVATRPRLLKLTGEEQIRIDGDSLPRGLTLLHIEIDTGDRVRRIPVSLRVYPRAWVPVATRDLKRGEILGSEDMRWERREVADFRSDWPRSPGELQGDEYWMRRHVRKDGIIDNTTIELRPEVVRGDMVTLTSSQGHVSIETTGIALESGRTGDLIRVENPQYKTVLRARVVEESTVTVENRHH